MAIKIAVFGCINLFSESLIFTEFRMLESTLFQSVNDEGKTSF